MVPHPSRLLALVLLTDRIPLPPPPPPGRGHPRVHSDRLFLKALVIMIVCRLTTAGTRLRVSLLAILEQPTPEMQQLRSLSTRWLCSTGLNMVSISMSGSNPSCKPLNDL
jgi:hypothetical protein